MPSAEVRAVLLRAAEIVERHGRGRQYTGRVMPHHAIGVACEELRHAASVAFRAAWNSSPLDDDEQAEVVGALRKAAGEGE